MPRITQDTVDEVAEEKGLTTTQQTAIATYTGTAGEFDASDFSIPYVSLVQASSDAVKNRTAQAGDFLSSDGETYEEIECVPLHIRYVRDFFDKENQKNVCGSTDRITGYPRDKATFATHGNLDVVEGEPLACRDCPFYERGPSYRLSCQKGYVVTMFDLKTEAPFMFRVRGTAVRPFRDRFVGAVTMGRAVPWARAFTMKGKLVTNGANSWFAPELTPIKGYSTEEQQQWADYAAGIVPPAPVAETHTVDADDLPWE